MAGFGVSGVETLGYAKKAQVNNKAMYVHNNASLL